MEKIAVRIKKYIGLPIFGSLAFLLMSAAYQHKGKPHAGNHQAVLDTISIAVMGDLMLGSSYPSTDYLPDTADGNILRCAMPWLQSADLRIGNLEGAIADTVSVYKDCGDGKNCYAFRTPFYIAKWFVDAGFNYLNLANNHSFDFGPNGARSTLDFLKNNNIRTSGVLQHPLDTLTVRGTCIGFVSFAPHKNCLDLNNDSLVEAYTRLAKAQCDVLIVFFHGGAEGATKMHVPPGHELFFDQDRGDIRKFTRLCIDAGADAVIGSGPHVVRGMELYKNKLICYSLGNFATYHLFNLKPPMNVAPLLQLKVTQKGDIVSTKIVSFLQHGEGIPKPDSSRQAKNMLRTLSLKDFGYEGIK